MGVTAALTLLIPEAAKLGGYEASDYPYYLVAIRSAGHIHYALGIFFCRKSSFIIFTRPHRYMTIQISDLKLRIKRGSIVFLGLFFLFLMLVFLNFPLS